MTTVTSTDLTTDDTPLPAVEETAPVERGRHFWDRRLEGGEWEHYELREYKRSVEDLWHRLCEADAPIPLADALGNLDAFAGHAIKMLYLLSHEPWQYRHLRADTPLFLEAVEQWGEVNVPRERTVAAVTLALKIHNAAHAADDAAPQSAERPAAA